MNKKANIPLEEYHQHPALGSTDIGRLLDRPSVFKAHRDKVVQELKKVLARDRARSKVYPVSDLGLVQMTRQRVRPSLLHQYTDPCPNCEGTGKVLSHDSILLLIERAMRRVASTTRERRLVLTVSPDMAVQIASEETGRLRALEKYIRRSIEVSDDDELGREEFRILSGKFGLLAAADPIPWYDHLLLPAEVSDHARLVADQLDALGPERVLLFARPEEDDPRVAPYRSSLAEACRRCGVHCAVVDYPVIPPAVGDLLALARGVST